MIYHVQAKLRVDAASALFAKLTDGTIEKQRPDGPELVDSMQPSAMADYSAVYEIVSAMRVVPLNPKAVIVLAVILVVPFLPLALTEQSIWDVLKMIGDSVL